ncbi:hypothetical protein BDP27DRAFT_1228137, partial [Rhodocollybia butyracea]
RCFPHIVHLGCQAVIHVAEDSTQSARGIAQRLPGALTKLRTGISEIRKSGVRRDAFQQLVAAKFSRPLQLLRDVNVRWSSTQLMLKRGLEMREVMDSFLKDPAYGDLSQYVLNEQEWLALKQLSRVLEIPHSFQQLLSKEKTPTLCDFLPSFARMIELWEELQRQLPEMRQSIQAGLSKIKDYHKRMARVPAYALAMGELTYLNILM